jgi:thiol-disulfide isomerase/thioredoxin
MVSFPRLDSTSSHSKNLSPGDCRQAGGHRQLLTTYETLPFWATWCGPCIAELPNMQKNYAKYHDKGFEIVAVSLDTDKKKVEKFLADRKLPWKTLYNDDSKANGFNHPLAVHYGITAIPSMFLVDQKGNVVSLQARGSELTKKLDELLGKIEVAE